MPWWYKIRLSVDWMINYINNDICNIYEIIDYLLNYIVLST
jgi:hypothetical protein